MEVFQIFDSLDQEIDSWFMNHKTLIPSLQFESHYSLILSFTNIWGLCLNFVECESFLKSSSPDILALRETNMDDSIHSGNFSMGGYFSLILCEERSSFCKQPISRKLWRFLLMFLTGFMLLSSTLLLFPLSATFFVNMHHVISRNIDEVPSANVFFCGYFTVYHKDLLTYSGEADRPGELCFDFSLSNDLTWMVNFPTPWCPEGLIPPSWGHIPIWLTL